MVEKDSAYVSNPQTARFKSDIMKHHFLAMFLTVLLLCVPCLADEVPPLEADVCIYGGNASGVMAAIAAKKEGAGVVLIEPSRWLGGMTGGGINNLDWGNPAAVGGTTLKVLADESGGAASLKTLGSKEDQYGSVTRKGKGNAVYRQRFREIVAAHDIKVIYDHRLGGVKMNGKAIRSVTLDHAPVDATGCPIPEPIQRNALTVQARVFIDCSYEGDLLAMSGVTYTWGRESRKQYGESLAGVRPSLWVYDIDPYVEPGNPQSGLIPFVQGIKIGPLGSADKLTMGYCFRFKFDRNGKGIPIPAPQAYDPAEFELYRRAFKNDINIFANRKMRKLGSIEQSKGHPWIATNLSRSLWANTVYGSNAGYPNGDWPTRARIWKFQQQFFCKLIHFVKTDPSVPKALKSHVEKLRFKRGVFDETGGWPNQLYVREARRMVSDYVVRQQDLEGKTDPPHCVGLASYGVDDWPYATVVKNGKIALQGGEFSILFLDGDKYSGIYKIPYETIVPRKGECKNLIVPVCLSASHIAMTSIRMEPVWMVLGESAGVAAAMAANGRTPVQDVPYEPLKAKLLDLGQKLERPHSRAVAAQREHSWPSQAAWNRDKRGYEWVFGLIDQDSDGIVTAGEYEDFQKFKQEHDDWEKALRQRVMK